MSTTESKSWEAEKDQRVCSPLYMLESTILTLLLLVLVGCRLGSICEWLQHLGTTYSVVGPVILLVSLALLFQTWAIQWMFVFFAFDVSAV